MGKVFHTLKWKKIGLFVKNFSHLHHSQHTAIREYIVPLMGYKIYKGLAFNLHIIIVQGLGSYGILTDLFFISLLYRVFKDFSEKEKKMRKLMILKGGSDDNQIF